MGRTARRRPAGPDSCVAAPLGPCPYRIRAFCPSQASLTCATSRAPAVRVTLADTRGREGSPSGLRRIIPHEHLLDRQPEQVGEPEREREARVVLAPL